MTQPQKNSALAIAIVCGLISLPMTWMAIQGAQIQGGLGGLFNSALGGVTINVNGFNGHVTVLFKAPIWFIVSVAIAANVLQFMHNTRSFAIPPIAEWLTAIVATVWISIAVCIGMFASGSSLGFGAILGLACAVIPLVCLIKETSQEQETISNTQQTDA